MAKKLYVGNLSYDTTEDGLNTVFAEVGEVASVTIITDRRSGRSKGFGFVEMADSSEGARYQRHERPQCRRPRPQGQRSKGTFPVSTSRPRPVDGGRQRCVNCGHPRVEHRGELGCTVPKCACVDYILPDEDSSRRKR